MDFTPLTARTLYEGNKASDNDNNLIYRTEFHQIAQEFIQDLGLFRDKYPLITLISMVAFTLFGFLTMFSLSLTNVISGACLMTLGGSLAMSVKWNETEYWYNIAASVSRIFTSRAQK